MAERVGIDLDEDRDHNGVDFRAWAPPGKIFLENGLHLIDLGEVPRGKRPNYHKMIIRLVLIQCPFGPDCKWCAEIRGGSYYG